MGSKTSFIDLILDAVQYFAAKHAVNTKQFKVNGGTIVFRVSRFIGGLGLLSILIAVGVAFIPDQPGKIVLMALFLMLGVPLFLYAVFAKLYLDDEKVTYRNPIGIKKHIQWQDVRAIYTASVQGDLLICSDNTTITVYSHYKGFIYIYQLLTELVPEAFGEESALNAKNPKAFKKSNGMNVFSIQGIVKVLGIFFMLFMIGAVFFIPAQQVTPPIMGSHFLAKVTLVSIMALPTSFLFLYGFVTKLYLDKERIIHRNWLGLTKRICWKDVDCVCSSSVDSSREWIKVYGNGKRFKIDTSFNGYNIIEEMIMRRSPASSLEKTNPSISNK